jgi:hypothetical protein
MENHPPETEQSGATTPPHSTALATSIRVPAGSPVMSRSPARRRGFRGLVESALDRLDVLADRIADVAGLR